MIKLKTKVTYLYFVLMLSPATSLAACLDDEAKVTIFGSETCMNLEAFIRNLFSWAVGIIGTAVMLGLIYAGYTYVTAAGNPDSIAKAKDIIVTSLTSIAILIFSWALFNLLGLT